ncbi:MAG: MucB/RseB C-terminal domain-containing protein [Gammaproteobacteria bacterium]
MTAVKRLFLSFFLSTGTVSAQDTHLTARQALINMNHAMQILNYQGTVAFFRNDKLETMKYFHAVKNGQQQERLLSLNSPLREVIRDAGRVSCRFHDNQSVVVEHRPYEHSFIIDLPDDFNQLPDVYHFVLEGEEDIAMLPSYVIGIRPHDAYRYGRKVWIEKRNFLPLKSAIFDGSGEILDQVVFTEQQVGEQLSFVDFKLPDGIRSNKSSVLSPDRSAFDFARLPPGFKSVFFTRRPMHDPNQLVDHLVISDGFAMISIYMENANPSMRTGLQSAGAVNSFSHVLDDRQITVMGEVPAITVQMIAEGIKLKGTGRD